MIGYKPQAGDYVVIERQDSGRRFVVKVNHVTKGGRVQFIAPKAGKSVLGKARTMNNRNERFVRLANVQEADYFNRQFERAS